MDHATLIVVLGVLFLAALVLDAVGHIVHIPRVTLLMLLGTVLGPPILDVLPPALAGSNDGFAAVSLTMVAFLLGGALERETLAAHGREILAMSLAVVGSSLVLVAAGLLAAGMAAVPALALAGISAATAPAATRDVIQQSGRKGRFATNILGIVAIDDAWGLLAFSAALMVAGGLSGFGAADSILHGLWEAGGGILLGTLIGFPAAYLTGRLKRGEPSLLEALGVVLVCAGTALLLEVSFLLAGMMCGAIVVNFARHHNYPFHEIERIEWPFLLLFFVMAGASLEFDAVVSFGLVGIIYIAARMAARLVGGWIGARFAGVSAREGFYTGLALTPQAGVAIGMALVASNRFPEHGELIMAITIASTIIFEIIGPVLTQLALARMPDIPTEKNAGAR